MQTGALQAALAMAMLFMPAAGVPAAAQRPATSAKTRAIPSPEARVDINHASLDELMKIPGMTGSWAGRVVRFRPYHAKNDLLNRGVLPSDVYDRIKDYIVAHRERK